LKKAIRRLRALYGQTPAAEFGPKKLAAVRQKMVEDGLSRGVVNRSIDRVRRVFKWATAEELIPVTVYQGLRTLAGLRAGRTEAPDHEPVKPVDPVHVEKSLTHLNRHVCAMVELQRLTGMRPGEVCRLKMDEVDRSGALWLYRPVRHKSAHHGKDRVIPLGPRARAVIASFLVNDKPPPAGFEAINLDDLTARLVAADAYQEAGREKDANLLRSGVPVVIVTGCVIDPTSPLFSPREAREERYRNQRANRKSRVPPSQVDRSSKNPKRPVGSRYTSESYAHAVQWAVEKAGLSHWHPNQLRHLFATEVRSAHGLEAAQVLLGHSRADVTQVYAERNLVLAVKVAAEMG
jgi:site-specific recombinase XerD